MTELEIATTNLRGSAVTRDKKTHMLLRVTRCEGPQGSRTSPHDGTGGLADVELWHRLMSRTKEFQ
jgi:hypothetical protein